MPVKSKEENEIANRLEEKIGAIYGKDKTKVIEYQEGCYFIQIKNKGNYLIDEDGNIEKENLEIGKENVEAGWEIVSRANIENEWYAYTDSENNIKKVNSPKLAKGMNAIKYIGDTDKTEETLNFLTSGSRWANAMTKDGSMWVWIPRFAYKITYTDAQDKSLGGKIEVAFLKGRTNEFIDSTNTGKVENDINNVTYTENDDGTLSQDQWFLAPAFKFGNSQITGFWFAKFEASNTEGYVKEEANSTELTLKIQPKVKSWRSITAANAFSICMDLKNDNTYFENNSNIDTHLIKNVEWGAVAYLAHSTYGLNGVEICNHADYAYTTGSSSGTSSSWGTNYNDYNSKKVTPASTTKNVYGIYDMSGGAYDMVAGCKEGYTSILTEDNNLIEKYINVYEKSGYGYGDAISETKGWFQDYQGAFWSTYNMYTRGFVAYQGPATGLFAFYGSTGTSSEAESFRPACIVE